MLKWFVGFLVLAGAAAWIAVPIAMATGGSWCGRVGSYADNQRLLHQGELPWDAALRVRLSSCGDGIQQAHPFRP